MPYLGTLTITHPFCQSKIADDFVQGLTYLKELSVQGPHHGIVYVETFMLVHNVTKAIVNLDKISKLTLINIGDKIKMKFLRCDSDFYNMTGLFELEEIDISNNYFKFEPVDCNQFPVSLNILIIRGNCISESMLTEIVLKVNTKLVTVDASDQNRCGEEMDNDKAVSLPKETEKTINMYNLKKFIFTKSIHKLDFGSEKNSYPLLKYLDISFNNFTSPHEKPSDVITNFFSASRPNLEYLNVSNCGIKDLQHYSLSNFSKLKYLDFSSNKLGKMKRELSDELSILTSLKEMNLANNNVDCIQPYLFIMMTYIEMINISDNNLKTLDASLTGPKNLNYLDLSHNKIQMLQKDTLQSLDRLQNAHPVRLDLTGNMLLCSCETLDFLHWMDSTKVYLVGKENYKCDFSNGTIISSNFLSYIIQRLDEDCSVPNTAVMIGVSTFVALCVAVIIGVSIWTASSEFGTYSLCEQRRFRRACASAQSRQNLRCSLIQAVSQEEPSDRKPDPLSL